jgi:PAS domain S-box-containing protein
MKITKANSILIATIVFFLIIIIYLSYIKFTKYKANIINNINKELYIAAISIPYVLNEGFHQRAIDKNTISKEEDSLNIKNLSELNDKIGLKYLYTVIQKNGNYYLTSSSATKDEILENKQVKYFTLYEDANEILKNSFNINQAVFFSNSDRWGNYRSVAIPITTKNGNKYLACADIDVNYVKQLLKINIIDFLIDISILTTFILLTFTLYYKNNKKNTKNLQNEIKIRIKAENDLQKSYINLEKIIEDKTFYLKQSEKNFQTIFNIIDDLVFVIDDKGKIININQTAIDKLKFNKNEIIGSFITDFQSEHFSIDFLNLLENIDNHKNELLSFPFLTQQNELLYLEAKLIKGIWDDDEVFFFIAKDVSDIKISEEKFSTAFEANPSAMAISDIEQSFLIDVNESFVKIFGYSQIDVVGKSIDDLDILANAEQRHFIKELINEKGTVKNYEIDVKHKSGKIIRGIFFADIIIIQGRKCLLMVLNDITERKIAEELLKQKIIEMNALLSSVPAFIYFKNTNLKYITCNTAYAEMLNISIDEIIGKSDYDFFEEKIAEKRSLIESNLIINDKPLPNNEEYIECLNGKNYWTLTNRVVYHNQEGKVSGLVVTILDISKMKKAEIELSVFSEELKRSNRELEQFAYIASHDLQEPLRKIIAFGDRLKIKYSSLLNETGVDFIERMSSSAFRMQKMINDLLTFSRISTKTNPFIETDLNLIINDVISDLEIAIEKTHAIIKVEQFPLIEADPTQLTQLFNNIIGNALKYYKKESYPDISITFEQTTSNKIIIKIKDNGIGFENQYVEHIFKPFIRLHGRSEYEGNGIGLAICKKIVERHKGNINAKGSSGEGSVFIVELPIKQSINN